MIEKTAAYKTSDGSTHLTLEQAQVHELDLLITEKCSDRLEKLPSVLVQCSDRVIDILSTTPTSKPRARRINGGTKKRAPRTETSTPAVVC